MFIIMNCLNYICKNATRSYFKSFVKDSSKKVYCSIYTCSSCHYHDNHQPDWNRAVSDAEKIVGYPTSFLTLRSLLSDEISNIAGHMRKLVGSSHPLLKIAKRLIYNGRNNMQTRGLIVLLMSKAVGQADASPLEQDLPAGVSHNQRSLAEITEMIHTAHLIHKGIVNLLPTVFPDGTTFNDMEFGNKMAILSGDYLLANACTALAALKNTDVVELISTAISDFMEAEFMGTRDKQDCPIPSPQITLQEWEQKNFLAAGSLMAKSCKGAMLLAGHGKDIQDKAFKFGKNIALAWQVHSDLQPFTDVYRNPPGTAFDLTSAPVIFHLQHKPRTFMQIVHQAGDMMENCNYEKLHFQVLSGPGVVSAKQLCLHYTDEAVAVLHELQPSDAKMALNNIIMALRQF